ncbi:hypothetical protein ACFQL4_11410 [Halosimplex aquaticum]
MDRLEAVRAGALDVGSRSSPTITYVSVSARAFAASKMSRSGFVASTSGSCEATRASK